MKANSKIAWTGPTHNIVTGCDPVSPGCAHCYARTMAMRLQAMGQTNYANGFALTMHPEMIDAPLSWKKPRMIFMPSMGDLFHKDVPTEFIWKVFDMMHKAHWHTFQILTKRSERLSNFNPIDWPDNAWFGVSIENDQYAYRADDLRACHAKTKFLSLEPLLGPLPSLNFTGIDWCIVGAESGPKARPMSPNWVRRILEKCAELGIPAFFKQWGEWLPSDQIGANGMNGQACQAMKECMGGNANMRHEWGDSLASHRVGKKKAGCLFDGRVIQEWPKPYAERGKRMTAETYQNIPLCEDHLKQVFPSGLPNRFADEKALDRDCFFCGKPAVFGSVYAVDNGIVERIAQ